MLSAAAVFKSYDGFLSASDGYGASLHPDSLQMEGQRWSFYGNMFTDSFYLFGLGLFSLR